MAGGASSEIPDTVNAFDLFVESGEFRVLYDGNDPDATHGMLMGAGDQMLMRGIKPSQFRMITVSGTAVIDAQVGHVPLTGNGTPSEPSMIFKAASVGDVDVNIEEFPPKAVATDDEADPDTTSIKAFPYGWDGTTWRKLRAGLSSVLTSVTGILNGIAYGQYNATPLTLADLEWAPEQRASDGSKKVFMSNSLDPDNDSIAARSSSAGVQRTSALASTLFAYNGAVGFKQCIGHNTNAAQNRYVMVFDRTTAPSVGAVDWKYMFKCTPNGDGFVSLGDLDYEAFTNGIYIVTSSSDTSYQTGGVASEMSFQVIYETL